jgi:integrase
MPKLVNRPPAYCRHKATGQAYVTLNGKPRYLGTWTKSQNSPSRSEYNRIVAEWMANGRTLIKSSGNGSSDLSVAELLLAFWNHAQDYYRRPDGTQTNEVGNFADVIRPLRKLYGDTVVTDFGPIALKAVRQKMIESGWCRTNINRQINRVKHIFRWGTENEIVPASVYYGLQAVSGLKAGRSEAKESDPVKPVADKHVGAVLPYLSRQVKTMVQLQQLSGMRPGEVTMMHTCDLETSGKMWTYIPQTHKTQHHGHQRVVYLGPQAQELLKPFLRPDLQAFIFQPADAERERREKMAAARETPLNEGNKPGSNRRDDPEKRPGASYTVEAYCHAIHRACEQAFEMPDSYREPRGKNVKEAEEKLAADVQKQRKLHRANKRAEWRAKHCWHPHQLRHTVATRLRRDYGIDTANVILGHSTLTATQVYAEQDQAKAKQIMAEVG